MHTNIKNDISIVAYASSASVTIKKGNPKGYIESR